MFIYFAVLILILAITAQFALLYYVIRVVGKEDPSVKATAFTLVRLLLVSLLSGLLAIPIAILLLHRDFKFPWSKAAIAAFTYGVPAVVLQVVTVLVLHNFVFQAYHVVGEGMAPTLQEQDYVLVSRVEAALQRNSFLPTRGSIVVFRYPKDPTKIFIKRVVALPGDHIVIKDGAVTVYTTQHPTGFNPDSAYESAGTKTLIDTDETVQPGNLFVIGDNRTTGGSFDSREWGELPTNYVIGAVKYRLLPLDTSRAF